LLAKARLGILPREFGLRCAVATIILQVNIPITLCPDLRQHDAVPARQVGTKKRPPVEQRN
jgi:hypothetical protein